LCVPDYSRPPTTPAKGTVPPDEAENRQNYKTAFNVPNTI